MKVWVDGQLRDETEATVSAFDHGITVGDGVFETAKVIDGKPFALSRHLRRLSRSAAGLSLAAPDAGALREAVDAVLGANADQLTAPHRLRITLTGGPGPLGSDRGTAEPTLVVALAPMKLWPETSKVVVVPWLRNERSPTAGLKTTSYAENVVALAWAHEQGAAEALFANTRGELCEGTGSNVFVVLGGQLLTPPLTSGCLAGVTRELVLEWTDAQERDLALDTIEAADEVFLSSSTRDVQGVHAVGEQLLPGAPGPVTREVARVFAERAAADLDP
jgi:branched-chain amino acid aminotransferase